MAISRYEQQIMNWILEIMQNGFYQKNERTNVATRRCSHAVIAVDCEKEVPLIKAKKTYWKSSIEEMLWIFRDGSNDIHDLRPKIWDEWADENGIVQKTYGYQIKKYDQVNRVLNDLSKDSSTRRAVIDLWNNADLPEMSITPCVYTSVWDIVDGRLNVLVTSRSCDILLGGLFNIFQYFVMNNMFARHLGVKPGILTFVAADIHIYENQFDGCKQMMKQYQTLLAVSQLVNMTKQMDNTEDVLRHISHFIKESAAKIDELESQIDHNADSVPNEILSQIHAIQFEISKWQPALQVLSEILKENPDFNIVEVYKSEASFKLNTDKSNFFDMTIDDVEVNYQSMPFVKLPVAV